MIKGQTSISCGSLCLSFILFVALIENQGVYTDYCTNGVTTYRLQQISKVAFSLSRHFSATILDHARGVFSRFKDINFTTEMVQRAGLIESSVDRRYFLD